MPRLLLTAALFVGCGASVPDDDDARLEAPVNHAPLPDVDATFETDPRHPVHPHKGHAWLIAHPDDDLLFMNPDIDVALDAGGPSTTLVLTAGDGGEAPAYWRRREIGLRAAYARMAAVTDVWHESTLRVGDKTISVATLARKPEVRLLFFRLPDGGFDPKTGGGDGTARQGHASLSKLWSGVVGSIGSVDGVNTYGRDELISTLAAVLSRLDVHRLSTLEPTKAYGFDHADHLASARFGVRAGRAARVPEIYAYLGYSLFDPRHGLLTPENLDKNEQRQKRLTFLAYCPYDHIACPPVGDYAEWLLRRHARKL